VNDMKHLLRYSAIISRPGEDRGTLPRLNEAAAAADAYACPEPALMADD
jgi:hypothetical protein